MNFLKQIYKLSFTVCMLAVCLFSLNSCVDEQVPGNRYTFTGETIADFLQNN